MRALRLTAIALLLVALPSAASAHHPTQAPRLSSPRSVGGLSEVTVALDVTSLPAGLGEGSAMLYRVRADGTVWIRPWFAVVASLPLQVLKGSDGTLGLGNATTGGTLRGIYPHGIELHIGMDLRFSAVGGGGGDSQMALVPRFLLAKRARVSGYIGAAAIVGLGADQEVDMLIPERFRTPETTDELLVYLGTSADRGRFEGQLELRGARSLEDSKVGTYVAALLGLGVRLSETATIRSTFELPFASADRLSWSTGLSFTKSL